MDSGVDSGVGSAVGTAVAAIVILLAETALIPLPKHANSALFTSTPELKL